MTSQNNRQDFQVKWQIARDNVLRQILVKRSKKGLKLYSCESAMLVKVTCVTIYVQPCTIHKPLYFSNIDLQ